MKKLIVICIMLAMVSFASAALTWSTEVNETTKVITATLSSNQLERAINILKMQSDVGGSWAMTDTAFVGAGMPWTFESSTLASGYAGNLTTAEDDDDLGVTGDLLTMTLDLDDAFLGTVNFSFPTLVMNPMVTLSSYVTDMVLPTGNKTDISAFSVQVTPEPMTMALLGLGGLFLRRRK